MRRDFILITGNQGFGKTVWAKSYAANLSRLLVFDPMGSYAKVDFSTDPEEWMESAAYGDLKVFRYGRIMPDDLPRLGDTAFAAGNCTLLIEECAIIFRRNEQLEEWAKNLIFMGRHQSVNLVLVAQRAARVPIDIRSQASRIVTFRQTEPDDLAALSERMGSDLYDEIFALPELHCVDWDNGVLRRYRVSP